MGNRSTRIPHVSHRKTVFNLPIANSITLTNTTGGRQVAANGLQETILSNVQ